jgi:hypothetical protein
MTFCCEEQAVMGNGGQSITSLFVKHYWMMQCVMFHLSRKPSSHILKYLEKECLHTAQWKYLFFPNLRSQLYSAVCGIKPKPTDDEKGIYVFKIYENC